MTLRLPLIPSSSWLPNIPCILFIQESLSHPQGEAIQELPSHGWRQVQGLGLPLLSSMFIDFPFALGETPPHPRTEISRAQGGGDCDDTLQEGEDGGAIGSQALPGEHGHSDKLSVVLSATLRRALSLSFLATPKDGVHTLSFIKVLPPCDTVHLHSKCVFAAGHGLPWPIQRLVTCWAAPLFQG
jgi:hypothetical protein